MKLKRYVALFVITVSLFLVNSVYAEAKIKVMWGKTELKVGQIGKVTVQSDTTLWKLEADQSLTKVRSLKKGEEYRVYRYISSHNGLYGVGGGNFVKKDISIKYETPSKAKLRLLNGDKPDVVETPANPKPGDTLPVEPPKKDNLTVISVE
ncbi:VCBS domain-containing protein [Psychrobacillus sp. FSL W7-1457]|uniref:VCBS domain-containing protein n=1 Tax=unclassified Psychrobacillus TaxID=2636677 RepID=UPI0030F7CE35